MAVMDTIDQHLITQFSDNMHVRAQQITARLRPYVMIRKMEGEFFAYDGLGTVEAREINGRFQDVEFDDIEHFRRQIRKRRFVVTLPVDRNDVESKLKDPNSDYADACVRAMERRFDRVVTEAMFADVKTGRDFENTITAANDGVLTVDATAGLTYEKLLEIHENFIDNEVGNDMPTKLVMGITGGEHTDLMSELELTSGDYSRQYVVDSGTIQKAVGINMVKFAGDANVPIIPVLAGVRQGFVMAEGAICVGVARTWDIKIQERTDKYDTTQIQITGVLGAVRTEGKLIQKVTTTAA